FLDQILHYAAREIRRYRKTVPLVVTRRRRDRGIDPDHCALEVDERTAGVARIDDGIRLNEVLDGIAKAVVGGFQAGIDDVQRTTLCADDAARDREVERAGIVEARVADRNDPLPHAGLVRVAEIDG